MGESEIINILSNGDIFNVTSILKTLIRGLGWSLIKLLAFLSNGIETVVNEIYSLNGFFSSQQLNDFIDELLPLAWVILALSIVFLGYKLIFDREFRINNIFKNISVSIAVFMLLPMFMGHMEKMTTTGSLGLKSEYKLSANKVIKDNLYDLYYLDENNFNLSKKNNISEDLIIPKSIMGSGFINIDEVVDESLVTNKDVFKNKISLDKNGQKKKEELGKGFLGIGKEEYYRYNFDFFVIFTTLSCTTITLLATVFKVSRIIFELGFVKLFALLYSFADIANGQKLKEVIRYIVSNFIVLFSISVLLKMYLLFSSWSSENANGITQLVLLIGASIAVIDGPNLIERIFGIDSGVKSGWSIVSAGYMGMKGAVSTAKGLTSMANGVKNGAIASGSMMSGFMKGLKSASKDGKLEDAMKINKNDSQDVSSLHTQMGSKEDDLSSSMFSTNNLSNDETVSLNTSNDDNNMQSVSESNDISSKEFNNIDNESIENASSLQNVDSMLNNENINNIDSNTNDTFKLNTDSNSLSDDLSSLDKEMGNLNNMERSTDIGNRSLGESMSDMNKSNLESKSLNSNISSLDKENGNLNNIEKSINGANKPLDKTMSDVNKSNLESKPLNSDISSLNKENGNLNNIEKGINGANKPLDKTINNISKPNLENTTITSKSSLNGNKLNENNINSRPSMLSEHIKQTLLNKPIVKNNYEKGISVGQTALNSLNKVKNGKISKNKKR